MGQCRPLIHPAGKSIRLQTMRRLSRGTDASFRREHSRHVFLLRHRAFLFDCKRFKRFDRVCGRYGTNFARLDIDGKFCLSAASANRHEAAAVQFLAAKETSL